MVKGQRDAFSGQLSEDGCASLEWVYMPHYYYTDIAYYNYPYIVGCITAMMIFKRLKRGVLTFQQLSAALAESGRIDNYASFLLSVGISADRIGDELLDTARDI
jgi:oligoendopeptidase F